MGYPRSDVRDNSADLTNQNARNHMTKTTEIDVSTPVLNYLQRRTNGSFAKALGRIAASEDGLMLLEKEIAELRRAVAKASGGQHSGGPRELRLRLAAVEKAADRIGEPELRVEYERRASKIREQLAEG